MSRGESLFLLQNQGAYFAHVENGKVASESVQQIPEWISEPLPASLTSLSGYWRIVLPNEQCSFLTLPWSDDFHQADALLQQAKLLQMATLGSQADSQVFLVDDAPYGYPRLVIGFDRDELTQLHSRAKALNGQLVSVQPFLIAAWQWARAQFSQKDGLFCLVEKDRIYLSSFSGTWLGQIASLAWQENWVLALETLYKRMRLRGDLPGSDHDIQILNVSGVRAAATHSLPAHELPMAQLDFAPEIFIAAQGRGQIDFVSGKSRLGGWQSLFCIGAIVVFLGISGLFFKNHTEIRHLEAGVESRQAEKPAKPALSAAALKVQQARIESANGIIRQLNVPAGNILATVSPHQNENVALLSIELLPGSGAQSKLKMTADARDAEAMSSYLSRLNQSEVFDSVYLLEHELRPLDNGRAYRFALEAVWKMQ